MHSLRTRRHWALVVGLIMLAALLCSAVMMSGHALHGCLDDQCPQCASIRTLQSLLRHLAALALCLLLALACGRTGQWSVARFARRRQAVTLITQKIRLNP